MPVSQQPRKKKRRYTTPKHISLPAILLLAIVDLGVLVALFAYFVGDNIVAYAVRKEWTRAELLETTCQQVVTAGSKEHRQLERAIGSLETSTKHIVSKLLSDGFNGNPWEMSAYPSVMSDAVDKFERELSSIGCIDRKSVQ